MLSWIREKVVSLKKLNMFILSELLKGLLSIFIWTQSFSFDIASFFIIVFHIVYHSCFLTIRSFLSLIGIIIYLVL